MSGHDGEALIERSAAAARLAISVKQLDRLASDPKNGIRKVRIGVRGVRFRPKDIDDFIDNHGIRGAA
jgi:predicted DNA-binding transcriptional regulator AlpA